MENYFNEFGSADKTTTDLLQSSILTGVERISVIVKGLKQFSRNNELLNEICDIHCIIDNSLIILNNKIKHKAEIEKYYSDTRIHITGDVGKLHQVFLNILSNSLQAMADKGIIGIKTSLFQDHAIIETTNDGTGMDEKTMAKITDPFFTTKAPGKGTGLGLSISYSIISDHNGSLVFRSEVNKGTKVIITFPVK